MRLIYIYGLLCVMVRALIGPLFALEVEAV